MFVNLVEGLESEVWFPFNTYKLGFMRDGAIKVLLGEDCCELCRLWTSTFRRFNGLKFDERKLKMIVEFDSISSSESFLLLAVDATLAFSQLFWSWNVCRMCFFSNSLHSRYYLGNTNFLVMEIVHIIQKYNQLLIRNEKPENSNQKL